jgi:hypothetical protein
MTVDYYEKNKEKNKAKARADYHNNKAKYKIRAQAYYQKNKEKIKARSKQRYYVNQESVRKASKIYYIKNITYIREKHKKYTDELKVLSGNNPQITFRQMLTSCKTRSKKYNRKCDIDLDYIQTLWDQQQGKCKLTDLPMSTQLGADGQRVSIDRIDSSKGYVKENCQLILSSVNIAKNNSPLDEFIKMCKAVAKNN